ncbi:helix-hairpin-helix domain-containing protein [Sutcliffiella cohnii]|uniref:Helix-hairpin-helix DNA-binding motif class 1 domain-containing protein n=1 Tax=Sutcliffiella cohnii TaxID=33932 RepID=A0A223KTF1_9BACI|nr:helix-hairpin-helix domain-containing protein [Sutcliffiella cohnii]AST92647.1 hypothetical protein BC6307_15775 [Sutcliffiella cohnii]MED4016461.1 helix-hairpin-helix domain-containing protein [Sutcliffiella cohnii]
MKETFEVHKNKFLIGIGILIGCCLFYFLQPLFLSNEDDWIEIQDEVEDYEGEHVDPITEEKSEENNILVIVDVKGEVNIPGVYQLTTGERVMDAIMKAGGFTEEANSHHVNLAALVTDEMVIYVPKHGEEMMDVAVTTQPINSSSGESEGKININSASEEELTKLTGIGPSKAKAIVRYREEHGFFKSVDELVNVSGIGDKSLASIRDEIIVGN